MIFGKLVWICFPYKNHNCLQAELLTNQLNDCNVSESIVVKFYKQVSFKMKFQISGFSGLSGNSCQFFTYKHHSIFVYIGCCLLLPSVYFMLTSHPLLFDPYCLLLLTLNFPCSLLVDYPHWLTTRHFLLLTSYHWHFFPDFLLLITAQLIPPSDYS